MTPVFHMPISGKRQLLMLPLLAATACTLWPRRTHGVSAGEVLPQPAVDTSLSVPTVSEPERPLLTPAERNFYRDMARHAWMYLAKYYHKSTGLVNGAPSWPYTTLWDLGGQLLGFHAAKELGLITQDEYDVRTRRTLEFLMRARRYNDITYHKLYSTRTGSVARIGRVGWTSTDLGRLLVALKITAVREPHLAELATRAAQRVDFAQVVRDGYLYGEEPGLRRKLNTYQEGRIGYEQYVAAGFNMWGADVSKAMDLKLNSRPMEVFGVPLLEDTRRLDRLVSEPFILYGIELGMPKDVRDLARNVLKVQEARYDSTGVITIASEDAIGVPPNYFYYYCVYCNGKPFVIDVANPGHERKGPRWVSTKGAFGWHAIMPNDYTKKATEYVAAAFDPKRGWASGVFERTRKSTKSWDVNTASVLLEIALYQLRGRTPLIESAPLLP